MNEKIGKNYFFAVIKNGKVIANYYAYSLAAIAEVKVRHPGCEVEAYDLKKYGFSFGDAPVIKIEGKVIHAIRCIDTGKIWSSVKSCCKEVGIPIKTLYTAIRRRSRVFGHRYEYYNKENENGTD